MKQFLKNQNKLKKDFFPFLIPSPKFQINSIGNSISFLKSKNLNSFEIFNNEFSPESLKDFVMNIFVQNNHRITLEFFANEIKKEDKLFTLVDELLLENNKYKIVDLQYFSN
jgi:hypothetical protein